jgi:hypothetical protein
MHPEMKSLACDLAIRDRMRARTRIREIRIARFLKGAGILVLNLFLLNLDETVYIEARPAPGQSPAAGFREAAGRCGGP